MEAVTPRENVLLRNIYDIVHPFCDINLNSAHCRQNTGLIDIVIVFQSFYICRCHFHVLATFIPWQKGPLILTDNLIYSLHTCSTILHPKAIPHLQMISYPSLLSKSLIFLPLDFHHYLLSWSPSLRERCITSQFP